MNLAKKKALAIRTLGIGKERIIFVKSRLEDIKEAITKRDIRDLIEDGAIIIKNVGGRRKGKKNRKRSPGNVRKKVKIKKKNYVTISRKLRKYVDEEKKQGNLSSEKVRDLRKKIRNKAFKSKANIKEYIGSLKE